MAYIKQENEQGLKEWQYKGSSASLTYKYFMSPFADWLLRFIPLSMAPNTITLLAFFIVAINHLIFAFASDSSFENPPATWKVAMFLVALFLYQNLDNIDGKQARRTKSATPIGMLFDHGADAITTMLVTFQLYKLIRGDSIEFFFFVLAGTSMIPNFIILWSEHSTGSFKLGIVNPIDEGLLLFDLIALFACFIDFSFLNTIGWQYPIKYQLMALFMFIAFLVSCQQATDAIKEAKRPVGYLIQQMLTPLLLVGVLLTMHFTQLGTVVYADHHYKFFYILTCYWSRNEILLMTCSVTGAQCSPFNRGNFAFLISMVLPFFFPSILNHLSTYLWVVLAIQFILLAEFIVGFLNRGASILGIQLFSIKPKTQ